LSEVAEIEFSAGPLSFVSSNQQRQSGIKDMSNSEVNNYTIN